MYGLQNPSSVSELRYALAVMEEKSHLGLDDERASHVRRVLMRQIAQAESQLPSKPAEPVLAEAESLLSA